MLNSSKRISRRYSLDELDRFYWKFHWTIWPCTSYVDVFEYISSDIKNFITVKSDYTKIQNANISVQITNDFWKLF